MGNAVHIESLKVVIENQWLSVNVGGQPVIALLNKPAAVYADEGDGATTMIIVVTVLVALAVIGTLIVLAVTLRSRRGKTYLATRRPEVTPEPVKKTTSPPSRERRVAQEVWWGEAPDSDAPNGSNTSASSVNEEIEQLYGPLEPAEQPDKFDWYVMEPDYTPGLDWDEL